MNVRGIVEGTDKAAASPVQQWLTRGALLAALIALAIFGALAQRHVGDSYFLADQVDQLQKFESALLLEPEGLWGPAMSGTEARALGPFGAIVFGLPVRLGLGINAIHALTSALLAIAATIAFIELFRIHAVLASSWLVIVTSMQIVWWNASMLWVNTLLLPLGLLLLAGAARFVRRPSTGAIALMIVAVTLALHIHLASITALPVVGWMAAMAWRANPRRARVSPAGAIAMAAAAAALIAPYVIAEGTTAFRNTRAMFAHVRSATNSDSLQGRAAALETLSLAADPFGSARSRAGAIASGAAVVMAALVIVGIRQRQAARASERPTAQLRSLIAATLAGVAGQALFFLAMQRPVNGLHYVTLLSPFYAIPAAALVAGIAPPAQRMATQAIGVLLGCVTIFLLVGRGSTLADRYAERTPWTYDAITGAIDSLCGDRAARTIEGPGLLDEINPQYDPVLRYLMKRRFTMCRYDGQSNLLLMASRSDAFPDSLEADGEQFRREKTVPPGVALYRRVD